MRLIPSLTSDEYAIRHVSKKQAKLFLL